MESVTLIGISLLVKQLDSPEHTHAPRHDRNIFVFSIYKVKK